MLKRFFTVIMLSALTSAVFAGIAPDTLWTTQTMAGLAIQRTALDPSGNLIIAGATTAAPLNVVCFKQAADKSFSWTANRFDLNGRTVTAIKVTGIAATSASIALTGYFTSGGSDTMFMLQVNPATGLQSSLKLDAYPSHSSDITALGTGFVVLGTSAPTGTSVVTTWSFDASGNVSAVNRIATLANYMSGTIKIASNGWNVFTYNDNSGILYLTAYTGTTQQFQTVLSGSLDTTYSSGVCLALNNDTPFVAYTERGTNGARAAFFSAPIQGGASISNIVQVIASAQVTGLAQDAYGYILSGTFSNRIWVSRLLSNQTIGWQYQAPAARAGYLAINRALALRANGEAVLGVVNSANYFIYDFDREGIANFKPAGLTFTLERGATLPPAQNDSVSNANSAVFGTLAATINYGSGSNWLQVGVSGVGNSQVIANMITQDNLTPGSYSATIVLAGNYLSLKNGNSYSVTLTIIDTLPPVVSVTTPGTLTTDSTTVVKWSVSDFAPIASRKVEFYSGTLGMSWSTIGSPTADSLPWTVVHINNLSNSDSCRFRITVTDASNNTTVALSGPFTVQPSSLGPQIKNLTVPSVVSMGSSQQITWNEVPGAAPITTRVMMSSINGGTTWDTIGHPASNTYMWAVPNQQLTGVYIRIAVTDANGRSAIATSSSITIKDMTPPTCTITTPVKNAGWKPFSVHDIYWNASDNVGVVRRVISYNKIGSTSWNLISDENTNTGLYVWQVTNDTGKAIMKIDVYDGANNTFAALSDTFLISNTSGVLDHSAVNANMFGITAFGKTVRFGVNAGDYSISVYDVAGRLMLSRKASASTGAVQSIQLTTPNACVVRLEQAGNVVTRKVLPQ